MRFLWFNLETVSFAEASGLDALDSSIAKFRQLRDEYRQANREYFGDHLFALLDEK